MDFVAGTTVSAQVVPPTTAEGMRKVKNITVNLSSGGRTGFSYYWAIVYVPEGTSPNELQVGGAVASMYEPNQFVMNCGMVDPAAGPIRFFTPLSRNLNSGDSIYLLVRPDAASAPELEGVVRYAISY